MSMTFYYAPMSTAGITRFVLEELGVPYETVKMDTQKGDTKKPEFLKLNPNGKVPTFVHDGQVMWESAAITMYLGETFGTAKNLWPAAGPKRGEAMKWLVWTHATLCMAVYQWAQNTMEWTPKDQQNAKAGEAGKKAMHDCLRIFDESLEGKSYVAGDFSLADPHMNSFMDWLRHMNVDFSPYARLNAWSKRCSERPAYARVVAEVMGK